MGEDFSGDDGLPESLFSGEFGLELLALDVSHEVVTDLGEENGGGEMLFSAEDNCDAVVATFGEEGGGPGGVGGVDNDNGEVLEWGRIEDLVVL